MTAAAMDLPTEEEQYLRPTLQYVIFHTIQLCKKELMFPNTCGLSPLKIFDQARSQKQYVYACAPMVRYSKVRSNHSHQYLSILMTSSLTMIFKIPSSPFARRSTTTTQIYAGRP